MMALVVLTLNIWGLLISKDRSVRVQKICEYLNNAAVDIILFQEVWMSSDYDYMVDHLNETYPFYTYYKR
jgi:endonuclease/exonuclease/phosphatase family metal-dependent hydrolase